ncbi:hypothetical protein [Gimesia sp.]|uniref:hypothetical protein n=1 Tax=Gimesia sp. TaxID=2024833 RepID=UPI003A8CB1AA
MRLFIFLTTLFLMNSSYAQVKEVLEHRTGNEAYLAEYNNSDGCAYWHDSKRGQDPHGSELMVRRSNSPRLRVSTKPLFKMRGVTKLILHGYDFTDAELDGISEMKDLPALLINGKITDDGLRHLDGLSSLKKLWIYQTDIQGTGLRHLNKLNQLECLYIDSDLSDEGFDRLTQMKQLKRLSVPDLKVDQVEKLRRVLPNTVIEN